MKKRSWMVLGVMAATVLWSTVGAQAQPSEDRTVQRIQGRVDGSSGTVLRSGSYRILTLVGQAVAGRSRGIWPLHRKAETMQDVAFIGEALGVPKAFALEANYPNPFNPATAIRFTLPTASHVRLEVFDALGREVARMVDGALEAGHHEVVFEGRGLSSGVYVYRMVSGSFSQQRTMLLVK